MRRYLLGIIIAVLIIWAASAYYGDREAAPVSDESPRNSEMFSTPQGVGSENVDYYQGVMGHFARPEAEGSYPGVVMVHEWWGLNTDIKDMAGQLAAEGYLVLAVDLFGGNVAETADEARAQVSALDQAQAAANMQAAADYLRGQGATQIASLGWCFGGGQSLNLALSGEPLAATVIYYGNLVTDSDQLAAISWPVLGIFGDQDQSIPVETVRTFETALDRLNVPNEIYVYPGVGHAFANPSGANYAPDETMDAWQRTVTFLNKHLK